MAGPKPMLTEFGIHHRGESSAHSLMWDVVGIVWMSLLRRVMDLECEFHHPALLLPIKLVEKLVKTYHIPAVGVLCEREHILLNRLRRG